MNSLKLYHEAIDQVAPVVSPSNDSLEAVQDAIREHSDRRRAFENYFIGALSVLIMDIPGGDKVWMEAIASAVEGVKSNGEVFSK